MGRRKGYFISALCGEYVAYVEIERDDLEFRRVQLVVCDI